MRHTIIEISESVMLLAMAAFAQYDCQWLMEMAGAFHGQQMKRL